MKQVFFTNKNQNRIAIYESEGTGTTVLFLHGNSLGGELFSKQLDADFGRKYHLITFDFLGHGKSDPSGNPQQDYSPSGMMATVLEVINHFNLTDFIIVGHSLGGHLILEMADQLKQAKGFLIFGAPPLAIPLDASKVFHPHAALGLAFKGELTSDEIVQLAAAFTSVNTPSDETIVKLITHTDKNFRSSFAAAAFGGGLKDETIIASSNKTPLAILHGENDQLVNLEYIKSLNIPSLWKQEVQLVRNAGHCPQWENSIEFNNLLENFILDLNKK